jgi:single-strand DNA-binding protein
MASVNKVIIMGNCGKDPEVRYLASGMATCSISIATSSKRKDKVSGQSIETTEWHRVQFFDKLAEIAGKYLKKGNPVYIEGRLKYGKFTNKDGLEVNTADIIASEMQLLGGKQDGQASAPRPAPEPRAAAPKASAGGSGFDDMDDNIPF